MIDTQHFLLIASFAFSLTALTVALSQAFSPLFGDRIATIDDVTEISTELLREYSCMLERIISNTTIQAR